MTLADCGDVLTVKQLCAVLQITERSYYRWSRHSAFPIPKLNVPGDPRFSRTVVQRYLDGAPKFTRMLKAV